MLLPIDFAEAFPDAKIVQMLSGPLGRSHFVELIPISDPIKRDFYAEMCRLERWSMRLLREKSVGIPGSRCVGRECGETFKSDGETL